MKRYHAKCRACGQKPPTKKKKKRRSKAAKKAAPKRRVALIPVTKSAGRAGDRFGGRGRDLTAGQEGALKKLMRIEKRAMAEEAEKKARRSRAAKKAAATKLAKKQALRWQTLVAATKADDSDSGDDGPILAELLERSKRRPRP
jgi:hypothetical protein